MGSPADEDPRREDEDPVHDVTFVEGYWIGKYEVTVAQHRACRDAVECGDPSVEDFDSTGWGLNTADNGRPHHPQNGLQWEQARTYCAWIGGRLPSDSEWEYAAKGPVHRKYPWGNAPEPTCANDTAVFSEEWGPAGHGCGDGGTAPVGSKPAGASWSGALDMAGNVYEWVQDCWHDGYDGDPPQDGSAWAVDCGGNCDHGGGHCRVVRGGALHHDSESLRAAARAFAPRAYRAFTIGCRCVRPLPPP